MKTHYGDQRLLEWKLFFETSCVWTSTKTLILQGFFTNCTKNKVVQNPRNKIVNKKTCFEIDIKWLKNIFMKNL